MIADQHVIGVELAGRDQVHARHVAQALPGELVGPVGHDQDVRAARRGAEHRGEHRVSGLRARLVAADEAADDVHPAMARPVGERPAQRGGLHLLRGALRIGPRHRAVHHAAAGELRCADRALAGPPGALLPVRLPAAAPDGAAGLGGMRALARGRLLRHHDLVDQRHVHLRVEDVGREVYRLAGVTGRGHDVDGAHCASLFADCPPGSSGILTALRTRTRPPFGPGTAPLISSRPRSVSTPCKVRRGAVVRTPPIRPAILTPLNTRPGVAQPPMDPGERCLRWVPWEALRPLKPCRFITPAKPLPLLFAVTSTRSPAANVPALTSWPRVYSAALSVRSSTRYRRGVTPAFAKWPAAGLVTFRGSMSP